MNPPPSTTPHDYRVVCEWQPTPTIVGGHAANLWALNYLPDEPRASLISKDLDIVIDPDGLVTLRRIPGWIFKPRSIENFKDTRMGSLLSASPDGRPLLVEVLHSVHGLDSSDLKRAASIEVGNVVYRVLDPVVMLKAKAANVRDLPQAGDVPRHDRPHLHLLARCVPLYLRDVHQAAVGKRMTEKDASTVVKHAFNTLQSPDTADVLMAEGISPAGLIPREWENSPLPRIRSAFEWQYARLRNLPDDTSGCQPSAPPPAKPPGPPDEV